MWTVRPPGADLSVPCVKAGRMRQGPNDTTAGPDVSTVSTRGSAERRCTGEPADVGQEQESAPEEGLPNATAKAEYNSREQ